jgi:ABC-2 type transport system ATP-binding protein
MKKLGKRQLILKLTEPMAVVPAALAAWQLTLKENGSDLVYTFDARDEHDQRSNIPSLLRQVNELGIGYKDLDARQSSLEEIFVSLTSDRAGGAS